MSTQNIVFALLTKAQGYTGITQCGHQPANKDFPCLSSLLWSIPHNSNELFTRCQPGCSQLLLGTAEARTGNKADTLPAVCFGAYELLKILFPLLPLNRPIKQVRRKTIKELVCTRKSRNVLPIGIMSHLAISDRCLSVCQQ